MKKIFCLIGKAGSGKDSIAKEICNTLGLDFAISFTTRPMRKNETNMVDYEFITKEEFKRKYNNGEIAESVYYEVVNDEGYPDVWYYGLSMEQIEKGEYVLAIVNPHGKNSLENISSISDKLVSILIETDSQTRLQRYLNRDEMTEGKCEEMCRRLLADNMDFKDITCDYIVYNDGELSDAIQQVRSIIVEEMMRECL